MCQYVSSIIYRVTFQNKSASCVHSVLSCACFTLFCPHQMKENLEPGDLQHLATITSWYIMQELIKEEYAVIKFVQLLNLFRLENASPKESQHPVVHPTTCEVATWRTVGNSKNLMLLGKTGELICSDSDVLEVGSGCWIWTWNDLKLTEIG